MPPKRRKKRKYYSRTKPSTGMLARRSSLLLAGFFLCIVLIGVLLYGFSCLGSLLFSRNPCFELKSIEMTSDGWLSPLELRRWMDIGDETNLFAVDFDEVRANLLSKPEIEKVFIQRRLPSTLVVQVVERDAVVKIRFRRRGLLYLLDRHGVALRPPPTRSHGESLPLIEGATVKEPRLGEQVDDPGILYVLKLLSSADGLGLGSQVRFTEFDLRYPDFVTVSLNEGMTVRFPRHSAGERLVRLVATIQKAKDMGKRPKTINLIPDGRNVPVTYY